MTVAVKKKNNVQKKVKPEIGLEELMGRAEERYQYALPIKEFQDEETQVAINLLTAQMARMAPPILDEDTSVRNYKKSIQYKNQTYIAVRLLVACAKWDIRIANFKLSQTTCADCGKKVKR